MEHLESADTDVVLLVGGLGTRLRSVLGDDTPKALALIKGRPFLWYLLKRLAEQGFTQITLATAHLSETFQTDLQRYVPEGLSVQFSFESSPRGTGGAILESLAVISSSPFVAMNGDVFVKVPLRDMIQFHNDSGSVATLALVEVDDVARFGTVEMDDVGGITAFKEKTGEHIPGWISAGVYVLSHQALTHVLDKDVCSIEKDVFPAWAGRGLKGFRVDSPFIDIGLPETYEAATSFLEGLGYA